MTRVTERLRHAVGAMLLFAAALASAADRPNVIVILADDLGYGDLGCYGSQTIETPHLDALAADGVRFTDFHSNGAVCSPTRAAFLTGRYQQRTGVTGVVTAADHRHTGLSLEETTIAEVVRPAGYRTGMFGKWHVGYQPKYNPVRQGFDEFIGYVSGNVDYHAHLDQTGREDWWRQDTLTPEEGYSTDLITEHSVDFIWRHREEPFFLYVAHEAPHYPYQGRNDRVLYKPGIGKRGRGLGEGPFKEMIEVMDEGIGRIRTAVEEAGLSENTLIFFFSDNGPSRVGSAGPLRARKGSIYEGGHRVPAAAYWPGKIEAGRESAATAMGADLLPTLAELADAPLPDGLLIDGVSLVDHLTQAAPLTPRPLFWGCGGRLAVRRGDHKLVVTRDFTKPALYHLGDDLSEKNNLAEERPELTSELLKLLKAWHEEVNAGVEKRS